jgi:ornithine carbamoyltransferase
MAKRDFLADTDFTPGELEQLFQLTARLKAEPVAFQQALAGRTLAMIFEKSSTRTRVSFEAGMFQLGGHALFLSSRDIQLGRGEAIEDTARVLARYVDVIMARTFAHQTVVDLARYAGVPVINGLSDDLHPCQALADFFTLREIFGSLDGRKLAYVGDGNNVAHSLLLMAPAVGMDIAVASPSGYRPKEMYLAEAQRLAIDRGTRVSVTESPQEAVEGASAVYTDVWASMGQEGEAEARRQAFAGFEVTADLMSKAQPEAVFLHCLPCHRGEEVAAEVVDGPRSRIFDEAENRMHVQKALLVTLLQGQ